MERIIGGLIFIILVTSVCFGLLISSRFFESSQMELNGKYKSLQFGNRNSLSSDHVEPRIDSLSTSTLKDIKDSPPSHVPRLDENVQKTPRKKLNPLMAKPKASMSKVRKLISKSFESDYEDPNSEVEFLPWTLRMTTMLIPHSEVDFLPLPLLLTTLIMITTLILHSGVGNQVLPQTQLIMTMILIHHSEERIFTVTNLKELWI